MRPTAPKYSWPTGLGWPPWPRCGGCSPLASLRLRMTMRTISSFPLRVTSTRGRLPMLPARLPPGWLGRPYGCPGWPGCRPGCAWGCPGWLGGWKPLCSSVAISLKISKSSWSTRPSRFRSSALPLLSHSAALGRTWAGDCAQDGRGQGAAKNQGEQEPSVLRHGCAPVGCHRVAATRCISKVGPTLSLANDRDRKIYYPPSIRLEKTTGGGVAPPPVPYRTWY